MVEYYHIIPVPDDSIELLEQLGTKTKYWVRYEDKQFLLKIGRPNTGENWAEKVACELCALLGLPHAHYEFALWKQQKCVLTESIRPKDGRLVLGNELLAEIHNAYPKEQFRHVKDHTLGRIFRLLINPEYLLPLNWAAPNADIEHAFDVFIGYLLLDAWIANQDRHHENWGVVSYNGKIYLAPTYDHAASMGQNETDAGRVDRLNTRDKSRHISRYAEKARSAIYLTKSDQIPLSTVRVFELAATRRPKAAKLWQQTLGNITKEQCLAIFERVPATQISELAIEFALKLLEINKQRLLQIKIL
jgi:HipA-like C-terminal domain